LCRPLKIWDHHPEESAKIGSVKFVSSPALLDRLFGLYTDCRTEGKAV